MRSFRSHTDITRILCTTAVASLLSGLGAAVATAADTTAPAAGATPIPRPSVGIQPTAEQLESWREEVTKAPRPTTGCSTATYPETQWREVPCKTVPHRKLYVPKNAQGVSIQQVGGEIGGISGPDYSAVPYSGHITQAEGSFDPGTAVTSECDVPCPNQVCPVNPSCTGAPANVYSLQLNSKPFSTQVCQNSPNKNAPPPNTCQGWQQFTYSPDPVSGGGTIQYWLLTYGPAGTSCPMPHGTNCTPGFSSEDGWCPFSFTATGPVYCVVNSAGGTPGLGEPITSLYTAQGGLKVTADTVSASAPDSITVTSGSTINSAPGGKYFPDLGTQWQEAEFNVFGDANGDQAVFNSGATVVVRMAVNSGATHGPNCDLSGWTGESNNLTLNNVLPTSVELTASAGTTLKAPALIFAEINPGPGAPPLASCSDAKSIGDTHLFRYDGLEYDFQASGDFVLAQTADLTVQTRQGQSVTETNWIPNATLNKAVATKMGNTVVALYIWPVRLVIDGKTTELAEGKTLVLPGDVRVSLLPGSLYTIVSPTGDSVSVVANNNNINTWLDVYVGLGHTPVNESSGLLGNPAGNARDFKKADGTVLPAVTFATLYHDFADSWRVPANQALLEPDRTITAAVPDKPFSASDLDAATAARVQAICKAAGVTAPSLLDDCMLDTAVLGGMTTPKAYTFIRFPALAVLPRLTLDAATNP
jgi:hypothetical protein